MLKDKHRVILAAFLLFSLIAKLLVLGSASSRDLQLLTWADTKGYQDTALAFIQSGKLAFSPERPDVPQTFRTPGLPMLLVLIYSVFGVSFIPVVVLQIFLSIGTIILTYLTAKKLWGDRIGIIAAGFLCLDILSFTYSLKVLTETIFTFILLVMIYLSVEIFRRKEGGWRGWAVGWCIGVGTLFRPVGLYMIAPLLLVFFLAGIFRKWGGKRVVNAVLAIFVPFAICVGGWTYRNYKVTGEAIYTSFDGYYLLFWHGAAIISARDGLGLEEAQAKLGMDGRGNGYKLLHPETKDYNFEQMSRIWKRDGKELVKQNFGIFCRNEINGILQIIFRPGTYEFWPMLGIKGSLRERFNFGKYPWAFVTLAGAMLYLLVIYGGIMRWAAAGIKGIKVDWLQVLIWLLIIYLIVTSGGPAGQSRYRTPVMPLLSMYAALGWEMMVSSWKKRQVKREKQKVKR